ncbi:hypothetical protein D3C75_791780 [compost metagenome]
MVLGEGISNAGWNYIHQEVDETARICCRRGVGRNARNVERSRIDVHSLAWFYKVYHNQAKHQGEGRQDFEVDQRSHPNPAELLHVLHFCDAEHHCGKNDRCENHFDEFDEGIAQRFQVDANMGPENTEQDADSDADQNLDVELP